MIWFILAGVLSIGCGFVAMSTGFAELFDFILGFVLGALIFGVLAIIPNGLMASDSLGRQYTETYNLKAINAGLDKISGRSYFLGGGYINQDPISKFYIDYGHGHYDQAWWYNSDATFVEYDGAPKVVYKCSTGNKWISTFTTDGCYFATFYIPKGSIKADYDMSLGQ